MLILLNGRSQKHTIKKINKGYPTLLQTNSCTWIYPKMFVKSNKDYNNSNASS